MVLNPIYQLVIVMLLLILGQHTRRGSLIMTRAALFQSIEIWLIVVLNLLYFAFQVVFFYRDIILYLFFSYFSVFRFFENILQVIKSLHLVLKFVLILILILQTYQFS